jgi:hypothetical protein
MHIRLNIEMRCARRQNDAAYQQYRRRSVSGRHAIIIHRRQVQHQSSRGMFLTLWMARMPLRHRPIVLRSPVNGSESAIGRGCIRATGWDAFILKPLLRVPYVYSAYRTHRGGTDFWFCFLHKKGVSETPGDVQDLVGFCQDLVGLNDE